LNAATVTDDIPGPARPSAPGPNAPTGRRVSLTTKLAYGVGTIAYGVKDNGFSTFLLLFYNQVVGLPAQLVGLAIMSALVFDAFVDPLIGHWSDNTRSRWGRRHPFMYAAALPVGALYLLLWNPPTGSDTATLVYLVVTAVLIRTAISCYEVPSSALAPELTSDYNERTSIVSYRNLFMWIGGMSMLLLTFGVFLAPTAQYPVGQLNPQGYRTYAIVASIVMVVAILASALGTHREIARLPQAAAERVSLRQTLGALRNRSFLILMLAGGFGYTSLYLGFALTTYFYTFMWRLPASALVVYTVATMLGVVLAFVIAPRVSLRLGKRDAAVAFLIFFVPVASAAYVLRPLGLFVDNDSPALLPLLLGSTTIATALSVGVFILFESMVSDVVEESQSRSGNRSEGAFFAGLFFMKKSVAGLAIFLSGALLGLVGFPESAKPGTVPLDVLHRLSLGFAGLTIVCGIVSILALLRFGITRSDHEKRLVDLAEASAASTMMPDAEIVR